jgi:hypothetical protein
MDPEKLAERIEKRIDKLEDKMDNHLGIISNNKADISWVKGYIKTSLTAIGAVLTGIAALLIKLFNNQQ